MNDEEVHWITGLTGRLFSIAHRPKRADDPRACVIMLSGGQFNRVGPQRLYLRAAREWAAYGYTVLRVDLAGVGDSDGGPPQIHVDSHRAEDVAAVIQFADDNLGCQRIVLLGLCAGARVAFKAAARDSRVRAIIAWNCPIMTPVDPTLPLSPDERRDYMSASRARDSFSRLFGAIASLRILTLSWWKNRWKNGEYELMQLWRSLGRLVIDGGGFSSGFLASVDGYIHGGRAVFFLYGGQDRVAAAECLERFPRLRREPLYRQFYFVLPHASHSFSSIEDQDCVIRMSHEWMEALRAEDNLEPPDAASESVAPPAGRAREA